MIATVIFVPRFQELGETDGHHCSRWHPRLPRDAKEIADCIVMIRRRVAVLIDHPDQPSKVVIYVVDLRLLQRQRGAEKKAMARKTTNIGHTKLTTSSAFRKLNMRHIFSRRVYPEHDFNFPLPPT